MHLDSQSLTRLRDRIGLFHGFSDADLIALLRRAERLTLADGQLVFREGTPGNKMFVILAGAVRISRRLGLEQAEVIATLEGGDCFGEMGLIDTAPRSADAAAVGETVVLGLSAEALADSDAALTARLYRNFASILAARVRATNEQFARVNARERELTGRFKELAGRLGASRNGLRGSELNHADLESASLRGADLRGALLHDANLAGADFREADLRGADLRQADFSGARLDHADFSGADLRGAHFEKVDLRHANFAGARIQALGDTPETA
ncbi:MAG: pentapeptide repeat-containing protein [Myxococcales bacterium]|nr:pentapeptide repeat-containing protein [Myxococcales bacterium]